MSSQHAPYVSNKYQNTMELLTQAMQLRDAVKSGHVKMGPLDAHRFETAYQTLSVKSQVLGYLEDLTLGTVHRGGLAKDELRTFIDWVMADTPLTPFPKKNYPDAYARAQWLRGYITSAPDRERASRAVLRAFYLESRPELQIDRVENLVLAGGGAKALSLAGAVHELERQGVSTQLCRVAGTSGGAIIAMAFAAGYTGKELNDLVLQNEFGLFTLGSRADNRLLNQWAHRFSRDNPSSPLHILSDNTLAHTYHQELMNALAECLAQTPSFSAEFRSLYAVVAPLCRGGQPAGEALADALKSVEDKDVFYHHIIDGLTQGQQVAVDAVAREKTALRLGSACLFGGFTLYPTPRRALISAMRHRTGEDLIRGFFQDLIYEKLSSYPEETLKQALYEGEPPKGAVSPSDIRRITFEQWHRLHQLMPEQVKELHISMSILRPMSFRPERLLNHYEHQDASHEHPEFSRLPVCDAVRVSMNLPPVYPSYTFTLNGKTYKGSDGGIKSNMSLNTFDSKYAPEQTIGVFYKTSKELEAAADVHRMLVIPRSSKELQREQARFEALEDEAKRDLGRLQDLLEKQLQPGRQDEELILGLRTQCNLVIDDLRFYGGMLDAIRQEAETLKSSESGQLRRWVSNPVGEFGHLMNRYLDSKSQDNLSKSHNLRRLVMINTHEIDTLHFKMPKGDKQLQLQHGQKAMRSLLNGTYCLENHFYYHHFHTVRGSMIASALKDAALEDAAPYVESLVLHTQDEPHIYQSIAPDLPAVTTEPSHDRTVSSSGITSVTMYQKSPAETHTGFAIPLSDHLSVTPSTENDESQSMSRYRR